ncbi:MAG: group III truncated hemoglobin [Deltaproteobacteria bacterium]|nr:group III truncated hemoglobin [Deltaproteobacteria bacterium]
MESNAPLLTTIDEGAIDLLVTSFYARVLDDAKLAPIFTSAIEDSAWPKHLERMRAFWSTVLLSTGRYQGRPVPLHAALRGLEGEHFEHWLTLFTKVAAEIFTPPLAADIAQLARRIGQGLARASIAVEIPDEARVAEPATS